MQALYQIEDHRKEIECLVLTLGNDIYDSFIKNSNWYLSCTCTCGRRRWKNDPVDAG